MSLELDEAAMAEWGARLGAQLRGGDVILLRGPMGAGKTSLTRALARGLGVARPERVSSPTYTVCMVHPGRLELVHVDLFRLGEGDASVGAAAFESLGLEHGELPGPQRVLVVEWSELWAEPPREHLVIELERPLGRADLRRVELRAGGSAWAERLAAGLGATAGNRGYS